MPTSLRLPPGLEADARAEASRLGLSVNGLVCVALDFYLSARHGALMPVEPQNVQDVTPKAIAKPSPAGPELLARQREGYDLTKPEKAILRAWRESQRSG